MVGILLLQATSVSKLLSLENPWSKVGESIPCNVAVDGDRRILESAVDIIVDKGTIDVDANIGFNRVDTGGILP